MKKFLIFGFYFFITFFILEKFSFFILKETPKYQYDKRLEYLLKGAINKDLLVLGSSRGVSNVLANQLEKETGLSSYNLSYRGSNIKFHLFILKTILKFNTSPKYIVLSIDDSSQFKSGEDLVFRKDALTPLAKYNYINETLIKEKVNSKLSRLFFIGRINREHLKFKNQKAPGNYFLDAYGSMPIEKAHNSNLKYVVDNEKYDKNQEDKSKIEAFREFKFICKQRKINLIYMFCPNFKTLNKSFYNRFETLVDENKNIMVYDSLNTEYKNKNYFCDESHLLINGAKIFTSDLSTFVKNLKTQ